MSFLRRRKVPLTYPAIQLRISTPDGIILETDSDELHSAAVLDGGGSWTDLIAGDGHGATEFSTVPVKIEIRPCQSIMT